MEIKVFLSDNREEVISYYNNEVKSHWNISLKDFMNDLLINFRKITTGGDLKRFDLFGNLQEAKSRLGMMDNKIEIKFDRDAYRIKNAPNGQWAAII